MSIIADLAISTLILFNNLFRFIFRIPSHDDYARQEMKRLQKEINASPQELAEIIGRETQKRQVDIDEQLHREQQQADYAVASQRIKLRREMQLKQDQQAAQEFGGSIDANLTATYKSSARHQGTEVAVLHQRNRENCRKGFEQFQRSRKMLIENHHRKTGRHLH